jgi:Flp pilus assembly protein TadD
MRRVILLACTGILLGSCQSREDRVQQLIIKGNAAAESRNVDEAVRYFREVIALDACNADAWNNLGTVSYRRKLYDEAAEHYSRSLSCKPSWQVLLNRSNCHGMQKQYYAAVADVRQAIRLRPDTSTVHLALGLVYAKMHRYDSASMALYEAFALDTANAEISVNLGTSYLYQRRYAEAETYFRRSLDTGFRPQACNGLALLASYQGRHDEGLQWIQESIRADPSDPYYINNRGYILLRKGDFELALTDVNRSIGMDPSNLWAYRNKGLYFLRTGRPQEAIPLLERVVADGGFVDEVFVYLVEAYRQLGQIDKACEALDRASQAGENVPGTWSDCRRK